MIRLLLRTLFVSVLVGVVAGAGMWAGAALRAPVPPPVDSEDLPLELTGGSVANSPAPRADAPVPSATEAQSRSIGLDADLLVGAARVSIHPDPDEDAGEVWQTEDCATGFVNESTAGTRKTATPDCIYMGGRGLGPSEPVTGIDPDNPLYVRSVAIGDGGDTVVLTQIDGVYWFGRYESFCDDCGGFDIAEDLSEELGIDPSGFFIAFNHSHNAPDFIGGWGGVPTWYQEQVGDAVRESIRAAVADQRPAVIEYGEALARDLNVQRRDTYWSAEDAGFTWFRALEAREDGVPSGTPIATVGVFSAHPVTTGYLDGTAHADFPGAFSELVADEGGGLGIAFVGGLGNMSTRQGTDATAQGLVDLLPPRGDGALLADADVRSAQAFWDQPITNSGLIGLRAGLFFDRPLDGAPTELRTGKEEANPCASASAVSVRTAASAAMIGDAIAITGGPGELFSNLTNTIKEQTSADVALPLANVNDGLGYIMQSFETDHAGRQVLGFTDAPVEYEDAFGLDHCFGDMVLQTSLRLLEELGGR